MRLAVGTFMEKGEDRTIPVYNDTGRLDIFKEKK
jgi:hypothetical protein